MKKVIILIVAVIVLGLAIFAGSFWQKSEMTSQEDYNPTINPSDFSTKIDNKYFTLTPGTTFIYEAKKDGGTERNEVIVLSDTKKIMGVDTVVVSDKVFLNGELTEDTLDWYAQDKNGNVWYFGEDTKELKGGQISSTEGSWEGGVNGALPGIVMEANPQIDDSYRQEYLKGEAEDKAEVLSLSEKVTVPYGSFDNCLKTHDYTPLDPAAKEYKYYCPEIQNLVVEEDMEDNERVELISIKHGQATSSKASISPSSTTQPTVSPKTSNTPPKEITEAQARAIAVAKVPGKVTDVDIETKFGKKTYVVEVDADNGPETDVVIDIQTGEVLAVEK